MRKLLVLAKYGQRAASTRYRFSQYFPALEAAGHRAELSPLLADDYLEARFAGRIPLAPILRAGLRRWRDLLRAGDFGTVLLNYEVFPYLPMLYEQILATQAPMVLDIDDAIFHRYDQKALLRFFLGKKISRIAALSRLVIAGNDYLADHLRGAQRDVRVIPTVVDTSLYLPSRKNQGGPPTIGWIGSPSTAVYLAPMVPLLQELIKNGRAKVVIIGAGSKFRLEGAELREWNEASEIQDVQGFNIGIIPLPDDAWSRGKCGFKLVQYMACGLPVVASPVGVNSRMVLRGKTGALASTPAEWNDSLLELLSSKAMREDWGAAARERAVEEYSLQRWSWPFVKAVSDATRF